MEMAGPLPAVLAFTNRFSVFMWTGENKSKPIRVDSIFFENEEKKIHFQTKTDTCGMGPNFCRCNHVILKSARLFGWLNGHQFHKKSTSNMSELHRSHRKSAGEDKYYIS